VLDMSSRDVRITDPIGTVRAAVPHRASRGDNPVASTKSSVAPAGRHVAVHSIPDDGRALDRCITCNAAERAKLALRLMTQDLQFRRGRHSVSTVEDHQSTTTAPFDCT
jgi:hypothetical protein